jgi:hypothetical protein
MTFCEKRSSTRSLNMVVEAMCFAERGCIKLDVDVVGSGFSGFFSTS